MEINGLEDDAISAQLPRTHDVHLHRRPGHDRDGHRAEPLTPLHLLEMRMPIDAREVEVEEDQPGSRHLPMFAFATENAEGFQAVRPVGLRKAVPERPMSLNPFGFYISERIAGAPDQVMAAPRTVGKRWRTRARPPAT
jgi:hypothetical protein